MASRVNRCVRAVRKQLLLRNLRPTSSDDPDYRRALGLFKAFREESPDHVRSINLHVPRAAAHIGRAEFVGYITTHRGKPALYVHYFAPGSRPSMYGNTGRGEVYFVGGRFKLTSGGFTDIDKNGKIVDYKPRFKTFQIDKQGRVMLGPNDRVIRSRSRLS